MTRRRRIEITIAWSCMVVLIASTVAAVWLAVGAVAGLAVLGLFAVDDDGQGLDEVTVDRDVELDEVV